ncbi:NAD(P)H-binding protein [Fictibacillus nanhaiensis]|uniref:NAD(P)H-binding protein n=1 Tax=Fictibacillus nanhaiensis TaxID=742169 RepID=A0ABS2ZVD3_9BACL|nr:NAD(P)H-binding protein [Fictibacillus nanhaiensis]
MNLKTVIVAGSSGLVGQEVVKQLLTDPQCKEIILLVRKSSGIKHDKIKEVIFDFTSSDYSIERTYADVMFICIGTTMNKVKSKKAFEDVDLHIPVKLGKLAHKLNIQHVSVISAMGAHEKSTFFYNRVKGNMESQLISMRLPSLTIVRPSLLLGDREEFRFGERLAEKLYKVLPFIYPSKYEPVESSSVAKAMIRAAFETNNESVKIIENKRIHEISKTI